MRLALPQRLTAAPSLRHPDRRFWWASFAAVLSVLFVWSLAMPLLASPDEPAHSVKAAAVVRGQLSGRSVRDGREVQTVVRVPAGFALEKRPCLSRGGVTADCQHLPPTDGHLVEFLTSAGRYPPLYYALVGTPSLVSPGPFGLRLMRVLSAMASAAFLASALTSVRRWRSRLGAAGVLVAVTPITGFLFASVNPNGLEISAAICTWASALALLDDPERSRRLVVRTTLAGSALVLTRGLSPLFLALIGVFLLIFTSGDRLRALVRRRDAQVGAAILVVATGVAVTTLVQLGSLSGPPLPPLPNHGFRTALGKSLQNTPLRIQQMIGLTGWLDSPTAPLTNFLWYFALGTLLLLALASGTWRNRIALLLLFGATVLVPSVIEASQAARLNYIWQGRYTLPLAVGLPLCAAWAIRLPAAPQERDLAASLQRWLVGGLLLGHVMTFAYSVRRYTVGRDHPFFSMLTHPAWNPPLPVWLCLALFTATIGVVGVPLLRGVVDRPPVT